MRHSITVLPAGAQGGHIPLQQSYPLVTVNLVFKPNGEGSEAHAAAGGLVRYQSSTPDPTHMTLT